MEINVIDINDKFISLGWDGSAIILHSKFNDWLRVTFGIIYSVDVYTNSFIVYQSNDFKTMISISAFLNARKEDIILHGSANNIIRAEIVCLKTLADYLIDKITSQCEMIKNTINKLS